MQSLQSVHYVYAVDKKGMSDIFIRLKNVLASQPDTLATLIYCSAEDSFIFSKELEVLQKRYPSRLLVYLLNSSPIGAAAMLQEVLESLINADTSDDLLFILSGDEEFINVVTDRLWFLGIGKQQINLLF
jgi:ferredoxin-NADP reductase